MRRIILVTLLISAVILVNLAWGAAQGTYLKSQTGDGAVLTLGDGSVWEIKPAHYSESKEWEVGDKITVMESKDCLFNVNQGESVDARLIKAPR
ncbi:MAG: hypothetical protein M1438_21245 [Deltaproteobacteria bacterium]|nr:hypothetical protein [Deltaproteobacteria bacterium]